MRFHTGLLLGAALGLAGALAQAQQPPGTPNQQGSLPVIRTETRLVPVDVVVTDKKGNYVHDLTQKDFKVLEDNKEQSIKTFSYEADPAAPNNAQKRYLVLFFDNSTMDMGDQMRARQAAAKFIDSNAGPNRLIAIANFSGSLQIAQNFTADTARLKQIVSGVKMSAGPSANDDTLTAAETQFGARSVLLALRTLAKNLAGVSGRKIVVMLTSGFPRDPENDSELTSAISVCNQSNVAVYPVDVRGLTGPEFGPPGTNPTNPMPGMPGRGRGALQQPGAFRQALAFLGGRTSLRLASYVNSFVPEEQARGGAGGGSAGGGSTGGGATGGGGGATTGGGGRASSGPSGGSPGGGMGSNPGFGRTSPGSGMPGMNRSTNPGGMNSGRGPGGGGNPNVNQPRINPYEASRTIVPPFPPSASTNQQILFALADGTGGFVIANTNDLLGGLDKIAKEQNEYYLLGYYAGESPEGSCHTLKIKVSRGGTTARGRSGYCNVKQVDALAGKPVETELEGRAAAAQAGNIEAVMEAPYFYTSPNTARVNVAIEIPSLPLQGEKVKGKFHSEVNILGIAYRPDGGVAAKFSDTVKLDFQDKKEMEAFGKKPMHYDDEFEIASGKYNLKVVFSTGGESFGKLEKPLVIDPYDGKQFASSGMALTTSLKRLSDPEADLDSALVSGKTPMVASGLQFTPNGSYRFKPTDSVAIYMELYDPLLAGERPPLLTVQLRVVDTKTGEQKLLSPDTPLSQFIHKGNPVVPFGLRLPVATLMAGTYRLEITASDSAGRTLPPRTADFAIVQ